MVKKVAHYQQWVAAAKCISSLIWVIADAQGISPLCFAMLHVVAK